MRQLFAVTRTRRGAWKQGCAPEDQQDWASHAAFMNGLHAEGFVLFGGPLEGTCDVLLIIGADDAEEIRSRLAADSWSPNGLLRIAQIAAWTIGLGKINA